MKIIRLQAENVKRLRAVDITPTGHVQVIAGRNAQGKTSVLDSIWFALGGGNAQRDTARPIRDGETKAKVTLDLGDLTVTRTWTTKGTTLKVENADGAQYKSPQGMLDNLVGRLSFDPLAFAEQDPKSQLQTLLDLVDLPFDPDDLAAERADVFARRTDVNREVKRLEGVLSGLPEVPDGTPDDEVSVRALADELTAAEQTYRAMAEAQRRLDWATAEVDRLRAELDAAIAEATAVGRALNALGDPVDPEPIRARLAEVDDINAAVRAKKQRSDVESTLLAARLQASDLTGELEDIDTRKATAMANAVMPVEGLGFDDNGVTYDGVPFAQCSGAERLRVSLAMAMAMNPQLRVIRITDGSLLDSDNMTLISEMAEDNDYQVWVERVDETGRVGVLIEDGQVVEGPVAS